MFSGLLITLTLCCYMAALWLNHRRLARFAGSGDPAQGIVVFVEPVRWLFVVWGFASFCRGFRAAGGRHAIHLFRWSSTAGSLLVIPDLVRRHRLDRKAKKLARFVATLASTHPGATINLVGYSTGAYVASEACKQLPANIPVRQLILLAPSASPDYRWDDLENRDLQVHNFFSPCDTINIIGPLLFGGNDRKWAPAAGAVGFRHAPGTLTQRRWRISDTRLGYFGGHFTVASSAFIAQRVASLILEQG